MDDNIWSRRSMITSHDRGISHHKKKCMNDVLNNNNNEELRDSIVNLQSTSRQGSYVDDPQLSLNSHGYMMGGKAMKKR